MVSTPEALLDYASELGRRQPLHALLDACTPCPTTAADEDFVDRYRKPHDCMDHVFQEIAGRRYKKGRDDEDLLRDRISPLPERRSQLAKRCPDLERLLHELC